MDSASHRLMHIDVMRQELMQNLVAVKGNFVEDYAKVLAGDIRYNKRAQVGQKCKDAREQVECLMDQASDENIHARMWIGWASFI